MACNVVTVYNGKIQENILIKCKDRASSDYSLFSALNRLKVKPRKARSFDPTPVSAPAGTSGTSW